jgi:pimeloyl-ACP methyl ester carboxylesterase
LISDANHLLTRVYSHFLTPDSRARPAHPDWPGAVAWDTPTSDGIVVRGWAHLPQPCRGTVLLLHPFTCHSMSPWIVALAAHLRDTLQLATIGLDVRHHGRSDDRFPTFGTAEMWDVQAALAWAEQQQFPQPFLLWGESLGAMAAARTAISDTRVRAALLKSPPAWPARVLADIFGVVGERDYAALNTVYGWDIVGDGDIRRHDPDPPHRPLVCYVMGEHDHHDITFTRDVARHWYHGQRGNFASWPGDDPAHRTWFVTIAGAGHEFDGQDFPLLDQLVDRFFQYVVSGDTYATL